MQPRLILVLYKRMWIILFLLIGSAAVGWHFQAGAGSFGRTPYGTAAAFTRTLSYEPDKCVERMQEMFPEVRGARGLCGTAMAEAVHSSRRTFVIEKTDRRATAICLYGVT